jgi:hypothetical protein
LPSLLIGVFQLGSDWNPLERNWRPANAFCPKRSRGMDSREQGRIRFRVTSGPRRALGFGAPVRLGLRLNRLAILLPLGDSKR